MYAAIIGVPYAFTHSDYFTFAWKQKVSSKMESTQSRSRREENVGRDADSANLSYLQQVRSWIVGNFDIGKAARIMYEEAFLTIVLGFFAILLEQVALPIMETHAGSPWLLAIPMSFFLLVISLRPLESTMVRIFDPPTTHIDLANSKFGGSSLRLQRILENMILFGILLLIHTAPPTLYHPISDAQIEADLKSYEWTPRMYLIWMLRAARKFQGACAMITVYRIYIDVAIQTSTYLTGYPPAVPHSEQVLEEEDRAEVRQKVPSRMDWDNANYSRGGAEFGGSNNNHSSAGSRRRASHQQRD